MNKKQCINVIDDLISYVNDEWDKEEFGEDIKLNTEALTMAIDILSKTELSGTLELNGKTYYVIG